MSQNNHQLDLALFKKLWAFLDLSKGRLGVALILVILARLIDVWIPIRLGGLAQEILQRERGLEYFVLETLKLAALLVVSYHLDALSVWLKSEAGSKGIGRLRLKVFSHIQKLDIPFFDREPVGKLVTRTMHDVDQINRLFSESLIPLFGSVLMFFMVLGAMLWINLSVACAVFLVLPLVFWLTHYFRVTQRAGYEEVRSDIQELNTFVNEELQGIKTIRHFGLQEEQLNHFDKINDRLCHSYLKTTLNFGFYIAGNDFLQSLSLIAVYLILSLQGPFDAGLFFSFNLYILMIFRPLMDMAERYNVLQSAFAAAERLFSLLEEPVERQSGLEVKRIETVEFKEVWFAYKGEEWVLKGVSFKVSPQETIALVGQTGSGKSTTLALLLGFYNPQKGEILINGLPLASLNLSSLRRSFSVVLQDPVIFSGTLEENLTLFDLRCREDSLQKGLSIANFKVPDLLKPGSLSTGERQLISLARAAVHPGSFYMLDEATAHIDPITEKKLHADFEKVVEGRSTLIIAHRLSTVKHVDQILVFSRGKICERGTHQELLAHKGIYEKLYRLSGPNQKF